MLASPMRAPRPFHFSFLVLPFGISFGFTSVALPYVARGRGIDVAAIGGVVASAFLPHSIKFLWAPVVDTTFTRKTWYLAALALVALGTFASMAMPITASSLGPLTVVVMASQVGLTLMYMACEGILGRGVPVEQKSTAAAWLQGGSFLGIGVGAGIAIELVSRLPGVVAGAILALGMLGCGWPLLAFDEPLAGPREGVTRALRGLGRDLAGMFRSRPGIVALVVAFSGVGAGSMTNLFGAIAEDWQVSRGLVELTGGWLTGIVSALGAGAGGLLARRLDRRIAHCVAGGLTAASGAAMAVLPHSSGSYVVLSLLYNVFTGMAFATFAALAYELIGHEGVATKYNVLASLLNLANATKTRFAGNAHGAWGGAGVLLVDAALTLTGALLVVGTMAITRVSVDRPARR